MLISARLQMQTLVHCEGRNKQTKSPEARAVHSRINIVDRSSWLLAKANGGLT